MIAVPCEGSHPKPMSKIIDENRRKEIERARTMTPDEKIREGLRLFDEHCERRKREIGKANPNLSDREIEVWLAAELDEERRWEKEPMLEMGLTP